MHENDISGYIYDNAMLNPSHEYLLPSVLKLLKGFEQNGTKMKIFDLGCGNGSIAHQYAEKGFDVTGVDPSEEGIAQANKCYPYLPLFQASAYDELALRFGQFPIVTSLEVVEHVYFPRQYASTLYSLVEPGGAAIVSTPYHGYLKNLALAVTGKMDDHFTALWDHGHIKFWSMTTLRLLLEEAGFTDISFQRVGRIPSLAKSMIAIARKKKK